MSFIWIYIIFVLWSKYLFWRCTSISDKYMNISWKPLNPTHQKKKTWHSENNAARGRTSFANAMIICCVAFTTRIRMLACNKFTGQFPFPEIKKESNIFWWIIQASLFITRAISNNTFRQFIMKTFFWILAENKLTRTKLPFFDIHSSDWIYHSSSILIIHPFFIICYYYYRTDFYVRNNNWLVAFFKGVTKVCGLFKAGTYF